MRIAEVSIFLVQQQTSLFDVLWPKSIYRHNDVSRLRSKQQ
jgi:hypothetical protein